MKHWYIWIPILGFILGWLTKKQFTSGGIMAIWFFYQVFAIMFGLMTAVQINAGVIKL